MRQFDVYRNPDPASARRLPYVLVLQSNLLVVMETVVVAPLARAKTVMPMKRLNPTVEVGGQAYVILIQELAAIDRNELKRRVENAGAVRDEVTAALDLLFFGF